VPVIRTFIAVKIDPKTVQEISAVLAQVEPRLPGIRWVAPANYHFTLKFLGHIDESKIDPITDALERQLHLFPRFTISAKGLGVFPDLKRPRVLWVGLEGNGLAALASKVERALEALGFELEKRDFTPHLTVGRWRQFDSPKNKLAQELDSWKRFNFGESGVAEVIFFQSVLKPQGAIYLPLKTVALGQ
jgi:RNA 2',3'-cyclic 3'-phosphodiesterase